MAASHSFTLVLPKTEEARLRRFFVDKGFEQREAAHAFWQVRGPGCVATFYQSGKLLIQGPEADLWRGLLGDETPDARPFHAALALHPKPLPAVWLGTDETGKGDYFGPLVVAGVAVRREDLEVLAELGVADSKTLSDDRIGELVTGLRALLRHEELVIMPAKYNALYAKFGNLNRLLAWAHGKVIENLLERGPADWVLVDKFMEPEPFRRGLGERGRVAALTLRTKAEADPAVAAASILARAAFVRSLGGLSKRFGVRLHPGAGAPTLAAGRAFIAAHGAPALGEVAKLHFATTQQLGGMA